MRARVFKRQKRKFSIEETELQHSSTQRYCFMHHPIPGATSTSSFLLGTRRPLGKLHLRCFFFKNLFCLNYTRNKLGDLQDEYVQNFAAPNSYSQTNSIPIPIPISMLFVGSNYSNIHVNKSHSNHKRKLFSDIHQFLFFFFLDKSNCYSRLETRNFSLFLYLFFCSSIQVRRKPLQTSTDMLTSRK